MSPNWLAWSGLPSAPPSALLLPSLSISVQVLFFSPGSGDSLGVSLLALASFSLTPVTLDLCILVASALGRDPGHLSGQYLLAWIYCMEQPSEVWGQLTVLDLINRVKVDRSLHLSEPRLAYALHSAYLDQGGCKNQMLMKVMPCGLLTLPILLFSLQFYGCISQQQNMMQDFVRTATYHRAILQNHTDFRDKVMLAACY